MVTTTDLPWCRTRAILLVFLLVACILGGSPCLQMFIKHKQVLDRVKGIVPPSVTVDIRYLDVEITAIIFFSVVQLTTMITSSVLFLLLHDVYHIVPATLARRLKLDKQLSTSTLAYQAWGLLICAILSVVTLSIHTPFVFTRAAKVIVSSGGIQVPVSTVQSYLQNLDIDLRYRYTAYIRPTAQTTWAVVPILVTTVLVTFLAARQSRAQAAARTLELDEHSGT